MLGYPVFCRQISPRRAAKKSYGRINVSVRIGSISISPNDFVLADANGIACIPRARVREAIDLTLEVAKKEHKVKHEILSGLTLYEILNLEPRCS